VDKSLKNTIKKYFLLNHKPQTFIPGVTPVKVSGRVFNEKEIEKAVEFAQNSPDPNPEEALEDVYVSGYIP